MIIIKKISIEMTAMGLLPFVAPGHRHKVLAIRAVVHNNVYLIRVKFFFCVTIGSPETFPVSHRTV